MSFNNREDVTTKDVNEALDDFDISFNKSELLSKYDNIVECDADNLTNIDISKITNYISEKYSVEHNDILFFDLLDAIKKGNNKFSSQMLEQNLVVRTDWINEIQQTILAMQRIISMPKLSIKDERELVKIEKAKRVDSVAVRHLSTHSQYIKTIKEDGSVVPSNIMTRYLEEEQAIYENRFLYALLQRMKSFVNKRYEVVVEYAKTKDNNALSYVSSFKYAKAQIDCSLNVSVKLDKELTQTKANNEEIVDKLEFIKQQIMSLEATPFMQTMKKSKLVHSPIQRTNILTSNPNYAQCYKLWTLLANYKTVGFSVNAVEKQLPFDEAYYEDLTKIVATSAQVMLVNNKVREAFYAQVNPSKTKEKEFKVSKNISLLTNVFNEKKNASEKDVTDFYYEKMKSMILHLSNLADALSVTSEEQIPKKVMLKTIYAQVQNINNEMFDDILKLECLEKNKQETDKLQEKYKFQKKLCERYKQLTKLKEIEVEKAWSEEKAQLKKLENLAAKIEKKKEAARIKAEKELEKKKKLKEKLKKQKQKEKELKKEKKKKTTKRKITKSK